MVCVRVCVCVYACVRVCTRVCVYRERFFRNVRFFPGRLEFMGTYPHIFGHCAKVR